ncbi:antibiotic biosynthesis monooxygenase [Streptomyces sp. SID11385]|uniref:antibiotic biosynthesis monooxygenase n=1 Tax=Streptomyces sp. SID11385 TaxID=2706031 RepID=UPI0013CC88EE|nr:hypothetical protein [Streptomyces sp. SID11385]
MINTFTLKNPGDAGTFERRFLQHVAWMRQQEGFAAHQAVRLTATAGIYVNVGWWARGEDFQQVLASATFQEHAREFHRLVDVEAAPSLSVLRGDVPGDAPSALTVERLTLPDGTGTAPGFEAAYRAYAEAAARVDGFRHIDLTKSLTQNGVYTALVAWRDEQARERGENVPEYAALASLARRHTEPAAPLAGDRAGQEAADHA